MSGHLIFILSSRILWVISGFIIHVALARLLGTNDYGIFGTMMSIISIIYLFIGNGMRQAVTTHIASENGIAFVIYKKGLHIQFVFACILTLLLWLFAPTIAALLNDITLTSLIRQVAFIILPTALLFIQVGSLEGMKRFKYSAIVSMTYASLKVLCALGLVFVGLGVSGAINGLLLSVTGAWLLASYLNFSIASDKGARVSSTELIRFAVPVALFSVSMSAVLHIDILFVKSIIKDNTQTGLYASAQTLSRMLYFVFSAFSVILLPTVASEISAGNISSIQRTLKKVIRYMLIMILPVGLILVQSAAPLLSVFFGNEYISAAPVVRILVIGISMLTMAHAFSTILQGAGYPKLPFYIFSVGLLLDIILLISFVTKYGLTGAAASTLLVDFTVMSISFYFVRNKFKTFIHIRSIVRIGLSGVGMGLFLCFMPPTLLGILIFWPISFSVYIILLSLSRELTEEDLEFVMKIIRFTRS